MERQLYNAKELAEVLGVSTSSAYGFIKTMNEELKKDGFLTVRAKVPKAYVKKRFFGIEEGAAG